MHQLVSIVVPAYNRARRIGSTLLSIAAQDYENIEVIVVDDGSADGTGSVAQNVLKASDRNFKVIRHESNMGVSLARNTGLCSASGDYVIFFDSDDLADPNFVSVLLNTITENNSDAAFCGLRIRFERTGEERELAIGLDPLHMRQYSAEDLTVMRIFRRITLSICTTMFKTSFLKAIGLEFTAGCKYLEDFEFLIKAFSRCDSINFSTGCYYIYMQYEDMTSKVFRQTPDRALLRHMYIAEVLCREARYLAEYANSPKVREIATNYMLADGLIKTMTVAARRRDKIQFYRILHAPETKQALNASLRYLMRDPGVFLKAVTLLIAPNFYFWMRSKALSISVQK